MAVTVGLPLGLALGSFAFAARWAHRLRVLTVLAAVVTVVFAVVTLASW